MVKSSGSQQSSKKLISNIMNSHTNIVRPVACFTLRTSSEFESRSVGVFGRLNTLETKHQSWVAHNETHESFDENNEEPVQRTLDVFKKPSAPFPLKKKSTNVSPNSRRNRKRWIKYSLKDIPLSSDATNSAVAFQFLSELRKNKELEETNVTSTSDDKLVFTKPTKGNRCAKRGRINVNASTSSEIQETDPDSRFHSNEEISHPDTKGKPSVKLVHLQDDCHDA